MLNFEKKVDAVYNSLKKTPPAKDIETPRNIVSGADELSVLADYINNLEDWELKKLDAIIHSGIVEITNVSELINVLDESNFNGFVLIAAKNFFELGRYWASEEPDMVIGNMSYEDYGRLCFDDEKGAFINGCYIYQKYALRTCSHSRSKPP